ncbi:Solute-binding protein family 3/N-terminal domain of MltF [Arabidopsis suecica]|uniref:Glutamate receptor n=1 Tax=Arabidopsis suecica TaxID=45249 RepID=A0A8T2EES2_ARASU|nr:Solute-binding protein family 3/N-terminal domain of MltF [Arabidopsis suecica]
MKRHLNDVVLVFLVFIFGVKLGKGQNTTIQVINVGVVTDVGTTASNLSLLAINMSLSDFYSSRPESRTRLLLNFADSRDDVVGAAAAALDLIKNKEVKAILGPRTTMQASFVIEVGQKSQVPIISFSATSPFLDSGRSPYFFRSTYDDSSQVQAISEIIKVFGWREVVPVYENNAFGEGIMPGLTDALQAINIRIPYRTVISTNATDDEISVDLLKLMTKPTRVFVVHMNRFLASRVFSKARETGLMKQGYAWILTNGVIDHLVLMNGTDIEAMQGVIGIRTHFPISEELQTFRSRLAKAFPVSELNIYGLRAYDATTALAMAVEEAGTTNLTFSKMDGRNISDLEALSVSEYGPKLIRSLSQIQFKGLSGDYHFVDGQLHASVFEIVNVIDGGGILVGFWTQDKGLVKDLSPSSGTTRTFSSWKNHLNPILWPGITLTVPKGWEIPTNGKELQIGVPVGTFPQFVKVTTDPLTHETIVTGFCIDFFEAVIQAMPYDVSHRFIPFGDDDGKTNGNFNDLSYQVYLGVFDAVVGDTTILANRSSYVDFTLPYTTSGVGMVVPLKDNVTRSSLIFFKPLTPGLWGMTLGSFFVVGFVVWILEHRVNSEFTGPPQYQISTMFWFAFSIMVFAPRERVMSFTARVVVITCLSSLLTTQQLNPTETSIKNVLAKGGPVAYQRDSFVLGKLRESGFPESRLVPFTSPEKCEELLNKGPSKGGVSAAFMEVPYVRVFLGQYCKKYKMVEVPFDVDGFGFVFPIGSPLVADVSRAILKVAESNKATQLETAWFKNIDKTCPDPMNNPDPNPTVSFRKLSLDSFLLLFVAAATVCTLALLKFVICFLIQNRIILNDEFYRGKRMKEMWLKFMESDGESYISRVRSTCPQVLIQPREEDIDPING